MEKEREIRRAKNRLFQLNEKAARDKITDLEKRRSIDAENLEGGRRKMSESDSVLKEKEKIYLQTKEQHDKIAKEIADGEKDFKSLDQRDVKLRTDLTHVKAQMKKLEATVAKDAAREEDSTQDVVNAQSQLDAALKSFKDVESKKREEEENVEGIMEGLKEATAELRTELEVAQTGLTEAERGIASLQTESDTVRTSSDLIKKRVHKATNAVEKLKKKLVEVKEEQDATNVNVKNAETDHASLKAEIEQLEATVHMLSEDETSLQSRLREAVAASEDGKAAMASASNKATTTYSAIMKATKKNGRLSGAGVKGRLGDLASIDPKYDVAISTACGSLDSIVVETTEGAQTCIEFLRSTNAGRANFLPLDRMSQWGERMKGGSPFPAPRLFDLIVPFEDTYRPAFYQALRDTLVVDSLESASEIAFVSNSPKWRVVTLSGELIDISGSMSGGGMAVKRGGMKLSSSSSEKSTSIAVDKEDIDVTAVELKRLDMMVADIKASLFECRSKKDKAEEQIKLQCKQMKTLEKEILKMRQFLSKVDATQAETSRRIEQLEGELVMSAEEEEEVARLEDKARSIDDDINKVSPNLTTYRQKVASLQRKILDVGGSKLARAQQRLDILTQQYDALSSTISTREVDVANAQKNVTKFGAARVKGEQEVESVAVKLESILTAQKEMEAEALNVISRMESAKEHMAEQDIALAKYTKEYQEIKATFSTMEKAILDFKEALAETEKLLQEEMETARCWGRELDHLRREHLDEQNEFKLQVDDTLSRAKATFTDEVTSDSPTVSVAVEQEKQDETVPPVHIENLVVFTEDELGRFISSLDDTSQEIEKLEKDREDLKATVNLDDLYKYLHKNAIYQKRASDLNLITAKRDVLRAEFDDLRNQRLKEFTAGFDVISLKLKEMYRMITLGGDAELELVDSLDPFSEGIVFSVRPPKKSWKNISNLSGGEKTLSSLALVFALHHYKPTALYVMDEIDAALDFKNVSIVANYIKERTKNAQFVIISLRNNMFELADRLVGIYKTHDCTKSVTINPRNFEAATAGKLPDISLTKSKEKSRALADATNTTA